MYLNEYKITGMEQLENTVNGAPMWYISYMDESNGRHHHAETWPDSPACYNACSSEMLGKYVRLDFRGDFISRIHYPKVEVIEKRTYTY